MGSAEDLDEPLASNVQPGRTSGPDLEVGEADVDADEAAALGADLGHQASAPSRSPRSRDLAAALKAAALTSAAAALTFGVVQIGQRWFSDEPTAEGEAEIAAVQSAPRPGPAGSVAEPAALARLSTTDLALPAGLVVPPGQGLLEVDTGGQHTIYVDGGIVGIGPVRRLELAPGSHQVRILLGADAQEYTVTVSPGRRTRLGVGSE
jgi:hypothetical protein